MFNLDVKQDDSAIATESLCTSVNSSLISEELRSQSGQELNKKKSKTIPSEIMKQILQSNSPLVRN